RYLPAQQGYDSEPDDLLKGQPSLTNAQGMSVDADIYIYFKDGSLHRFTDGSDSGFALPGIDRAIKSVVGVNVYASASEVYIVDSGNKRVVVASKDGNY